MLDQPIYVQNSLHELGPTEQIRVTLQVIYIYIYGQYFFIDTYLIEHYRHFLSIYFL